MIPIPLDRLGLPQALQIIDNYACMLCCACRRDASSSATPMLSMAACAQDGCDLQTEVAVALPRANEDTSGLWTSAEADNSLADGSRLHVPEIWQRKNVPSRNPCQIREECLLQAEILTLYHGAVVGLPCFTSGCSLLAAWPSSEWRAETGCWRFRCVSKTLMKNPQHQVRKASQGPFAHSCLERNNS